VDHPRWSQATEKVLGDRDLLLQVNLVAG